MGFSSRVLQVNLTQSNWMICLYSVFTDSRGVNLNAHQKLKHIFETATQESNGGREVPEVADYISLPLPKESILKQYEEFQPGVSYPNYSLSLLKTSFTRKRIDYVYNPEKYIPLLAKAGYKVIVIAGDATNCEKELPLRTKTLHLFQPYKQFDDFPGTSNQTSCSMRFVINLLSSYICMREGPGDTANPVMSTMVQMFGDLYSRRCLDSFIPIPNTHPYPADPTDSEYELKHSVMRNK